MLVKVLLALAAGAGALAVAVSRRPGTYRVVRSTSVAAPASEVFARVNDFHEWEAWSPWAKLDPKMQQTYEGAPAGRGAVYTWSGSGKVGAGRMEVTESEPPRRVRIRLDFLKPFKSTSTTEFTFEPDGDGTVVSWSMSGENNFMTKAWGLFMDMDRMIGPDFEKGLAAMKAVAEGTSRQ